MTVQDVIDSFREDAEKRLEDEEFAKNLFQDAIRVTMELNNKYHSCVDNCAYRLLKRDFKRSRTADLIKFGRKLRNLGGSGRFKRKHVKQHFVRQRFKYNGK